jgi:hypothetical protein
LQHAKEKNKNDASSLARIFLVRLKLQVGIDSQSTLMKSIFLYSSGLIAARQPAQHAAAPDHSGKKD